MQEKIKKKIFVVIIILSLIPIALLPISFITSGFFVFPDDILWILGSYTGLFGFMLFFWQYVMGIKALVQIFTKDIVFINKLHKYFGVYGMILILAHPVLLFIDFITNRGINLILPNVTLTYNLKIIVGDIGLLSFIMTWVASYLIRKRFSYRMWKLLHLFNYSMIFIIYLHADDIGTLIGDSSTKLYFKFISILAGLIIIYRLGLQFGIFKKRYKVRSTEKITYDTIKINMLPLGNPIIPLDGQFIEIQLSLFGETHPFTAAIYDTKTNEISIMVKVSGKFSRKLAELKGGEKVYLDGAYGVYTREAYAIETKKIVMIAGGIGITPFLSVVKHITKKPDRYESAYLFIGNKTEKDIAFKADFEYAMSISSLKVINVLSGISDLESEYEKGFINSDLLKKYIGDDFTGYEFFICGPPIMMEKLKVDLVNKNVIKSKIHTEDFSF